MASRYLLIEFDDEQQATSLRAQIDNATKKGKGFRVVGLFAKPGPTFCRCGTWITERGKVASTVYGKKYGWMVCKTCRKPAPVISFLRNLIKPEEVINPSTHIAQDNKTSLTFHPLGLSIPTRRI